MINLKADNTKQYIYSLFDRYSGEFLFKGTAQECTKWLVFNRNNPRKIYMDSIRIGLSKAANCKGRYLLGCRVTREEG